ncbi:glycosyltransferase involved in cell wall biosynthesis [Motilibacter peucedani]|uniref:Glycosyltransferase involved in cell wall biosynthesis n=1 Tax=Motilibacter peucedani TaxID=598650 RepID=A0A420XKC3_9ACTN|nr:glycosyltransferase family 4 protein [Motilibacter peucedani]RKS68572.1 glycosyltransferase involved in cell wall biosynthesis [Motilibacter peucedani]
MRVVHVSDFYLPRIGGVELHVRDLARLQSAEGHDVGVLTSTAPGSSSEDDGVRVVRLAPAGPLRHPLHPGALLRVGAALEQLKPDVLHVHAGGISPLGATVGRAAVRAGIPVVVTMHSVMATLAPAFRALDTATRWSGSPVHWTAVSPAAAAPLRRALRDRPVEVLPNGIDTAAWRTDAPADRPDELLVVAVMRLVPRKRPLHLLRVLRQVRAQTASDVRLRAVVAGDGPLRPAMQAYLSAHGMDGWVELAGGLPRPQVRELLARADVFVAPARLESFGLAPLEARCAGVPVVARADGGVESFVVDGVNGLLVHDDAELAAAVARLVAMPELRLAMAEHNRTTCPPVDWAQVLGRVDAAYAAAAAKAAPCG